MDVIIYKFVDSDCCLTQGLLGAPASCGFLEGVLSQEVTLGKFGC